MSGDTIKEFLVGLGFKVDENGLKKFETTIGKATKIAATLGAAAIAAATAVEASVLKIAASMDSLYFASKRTETSVSNIQAFGYAVTQLGGSVQGALGSLEGFAGFLRNTPAGGDFLKGLGIDTHDSNGKLRDNVDVLTDLGLKLAEMRAKTGSNGLSLQYANLLGIDEKTMLALEDGSLVARMHQFTEIQKQMGYNSDEAAKKFHDFEQNGVGPLTAHLETMTSIIGLALLPIAKALTKVIIGLIDVFAWLDKHTGGLTTVIGVLTVGLLGLFLALSAIGIPVFTAFLPLVIELAAAFVAMFLPLDALIIGAIALGVALGAAAAYVYNHWDKVKKWFQDFFDWFEEKYERIFGHKPAAAVNGKAPNDDNAVNNEAAGAVSGGVSPGAKAAALAYFKSAGWTAAQAAGLVAQGIAESGLRPDAVGDHGHAYGAFQWHEDRQREFAKVMGYDIHGSTLEQQYAFVNYELRKGKEQAAGRGLSAQTTGYGSGSILDRLYERSADPARDSVLRGNIAEQLANGDTGSGTQVAIHQKTDIHVNGSSDPAQTAEAVARKQGWVNGTLVRNTQGSIA